ncbi:MAG TPA: hypothetical protein VEU33_49335 [Archangium sp.]|nr:hypothetical protein [Archangium sp.]
MNTTEFIRELRTELGKLAATGQTTIQIASLDAALASAATAVASTDSAAAEQQVIDELKLKLPLQHAATLEQYKSVLESGQTALKTLTTINGGAAVALLAFIGNVLTKGQPIGVPNPIPTLNQAMLAFFFGVFFAGASSGARYLVQLLASRSSNAATGFMVCSVLFGTASLVAFLLGGIMTFWAF